MCFADAGRAIILPAQIYSVFVRPGSLGPSGLHRRCLRRPGFRWCRLKSAISATAGAHRGDAPPDCARGAYRCENSYFFLSYRPDASITLRLACTKSNNWHTRAKSFALVAPRATVAPIGSGWPALRGPFGRRPFPRLAERLAGPEPLLGTSDGRGLFRTGGHSHRSEELLSIAFGPNAGLPYPRPSNRRRPRHRPPFASAALAVGNISGPPEAPAPRPIFASGGGTHGQVPIRLAINRLPDLAEETAAEDATTDVWGPRRSARAGLIGTSSCETLGRRHPRRFFARPGPKMTAHSRSFAMGLALNACSSYKGKIRAAVGSPALPRKWGKLGVTMMKRTELGPLTARGKPGHDRLLGV